VNRSKQSTRTELSGNFQFYSRDPMDGNEYVINEDVFHNIVSLFEQDGQESRSSVTKPCSKNIQFFDNGYKTN